MITHAALFSAKPPARTIALTITVALPFHLLAAIDSRFAHQTPLCRAYSLHPVAHLLTIGVVFFLIHEL